MPTNRSDGFTRTSLKLMAPLIASVVVVSLIYAIYQVNSQNRSMRRDLQRRSEVLADSLQETAEAGIVTHSSIALKRSIERVVHRDNIVGVAVFDSGGLLLASSPGIDTAVTERIRTQARDCQKTTSCNQFFYSGPTWFHLYIQPLGAFGPQQAQPTVQGTGPSSSSNALSSKSTASSPSASAVPAATPAVAAPPNTFGWLVILNDATYIHSATNRMWRDSLLHAFFQCLLIALLAFLMLRWTLRDSITRIASWMKALRAGRFLRPPKGANLLEPLAHEAAQMAESLGAARFAAGEEARLREAGESTWTAERLRVSVSNKLQGSPVFIIANREPYMHVHRGAEIQALVPASGVVTALEPIVIACNGTWIAHGAGTADRETVDRHDRIRVPPDNPSYALRRVWLTKEEEEGYYFGFSNEGLWPLCHIVHARPLFRISDWKQYQHVNEKFADAAVQEMAGTESPTVLIQDYHFALLPRLIKERRPDARVAIFWHIPWPNSEAFRICPWQRELLKGLLGADLIGFHIQAHCNNFLASVDRALESLTDRDRFIVNRRGHITMVRPFPISVAFPDPSADSYHSRDRAADRRKILDNLGINPTVIGVGVDRVDYTKGILERFWAVERFLETHPELRGQLSFIQIGAPSRTNIKRYNDFLKEVHDEAQRINARFPSSQAPPIVLLERHHEHSEVERYYRAADFCMVTSLHDGMNLVAKEFIAARDDERGVLILSAFTGAVRELPDALIINPYDIEQMAAAIAQAIRMSPEEQESRMAHMRRIVREHNVYRWAGSLMTALSEIRIEHPATKNHRPANLPEVERSEKVEA
jgi:trehalose 6-phosphate synthase